VVRRHAENRGYGASLVTGFKHAIDSSAAAVITMDCDGQHDPSFLPVFAARILASVTPDVVSGTRYFGTNECEERRVPVERLKINREITARINAIAGWSLTDTFCGFKAYRCDALRKLTLDIPGYGFPLQFWMRAHEAGLSIEEQPIPLIYTPEDRNFNNQFSDAQERRAYYLEILEEECARLGSPCTGRNSA
jgi:dolichol-phosphate mannosyltransferase